MMNMEIRSTTTYFTTNHYISTNGVNLGSEHTTTHRSGMRCIKNYGKDGFGGHHKSSLNHTFYPDRREG